MWPLLSCAAAPLPCLFTGRRHEAKAVIRGKLIPVNRVSSMAVRTRRKGTQRQTVRALPMNGGIMKLDNYKFTEIRELARELEDMGNFINQKASRINKLALAFQEKWAKLIQQVQDEQKIGGKTDG